MKHPAAMYAHCALHTSLLTAGGVVPRDADPCFRAARASQAIDPYITTCRCWILTIVAGATGGFVDAVQ